MASDTRTGASWNTDWVAGEHGGESFKTTDAIVDVVNPQQIKVEKVFVGGSRGFEEQDAVTTKIASLRKGSVVLVSPTHRATAAVRNAVLGLGLETPKFAEHDPPLAVGASFLGVDVLGPPTGQGTDSKERRWETYDRNGWRVILSRALSGTNVSSEYLALIAKLVADAVPSA